MRWIILLSLLLVIPLASAISTTMLPTYQPGETMIIEISGNIIEPLSASDVVFQRAHVPIAVNYDLKRIGQKYYLYAQLPTTQNNYTLFINDIATTSNGQNTVVDFNQSFSVLGELVDYSVSPGFAISKDPITLTVTLNTDQGETINVNFPDEQAFTLEPGSNTLTLQVSGKEPGVYLAAIGRYTLPIQVLNSSQSQLPSSQNISLQITPPAIRGVILANASTIYTVSIKNTGESTIGNILLGFNNNLFNVTPYFISNIAPNNSQEISILLKRLSGPPINSEIIVQTTYSNFTIPINLSFTQNVNETTPTNDSSVQYYCSELGGKFCTAIEICSVDPTQALDGSCCVGECLLAEESGGFGWIGYVFIIVIILILIYVFFKYKGSKIPKPKDLAAPPPLSQLMPKPLPPTPPAEPIKK